MRTYRCDYIEDIEIELDYPRPLSEGEIAKIIATQQKEYRNIPFKVRLSDKGKEHFLKNKFPNMRLTVTDNDSFILGEFNNNELPFLTNYFLGFGEHVEILEPKNTKTRIYDVDRKTIKQVQRIDFDTCF